MSSGASAASALLSVNNLEVVYDDVIQVLRGVSLTVPEGKIVALLGANGAGKTTLLRAMTGLLDVNDGEITKGSVVFDGAADPPPLADQDRGAGHQAGDGRPTDLRRADRGREPADRRACRTQAALREPGAGVRPVPGARAARQAHRRLPVRRRAADAGDGPGADVTARAACCSTSRASAWRRWSRSRSGT